MRMRKVQHTFLEQGHGPVAVPGRHRRHGGKDRGPVARFVVALDFCKWDKTRAWAGSIGPRLA